MKTPIDAAGHPGATLALLNSGVHFQMIDLWSITLSGGAVINWHGGGQTTPIVFNGTTFAAGPVIDRGKISTKLGVQAATLDMKITAAPTDLINGVPVIPFAMGNGFDGATVVLQRGYISPPWGNPITGTTIEFSGRITSIKNVNRTQFTITVSSWTVLLNVSMGPDVFQAGCLNNHYDANCGLTPTPVAGIVAAGATTTAFNSNLTNPDGYFTKGTITFTSGANNGLKRAVKLYANASGAFSIAFPLPFAPANGDTFNAVRGCLLSMADCNAQGNLLKFRGQPFTPPAITGAVA